VQGQFPLQWFSNEK